jgi:hypothetical protein
MSVHSTRATSRHPHRWRNRERFAVAHVAFEIEEGTDGATFCIRVRHDDHMPRIPKPLCSGLIQPGMARELRKLAHRLDEIEARQRLERGRG